jgi:hypothetical protein
MMQCGLNVTLSNFRPIPSTSPLNGSFLRTQLIVEIGSLAAGQQNNMVASPRKTNVVAVASDRDREPMGAVGRGGSAVVTAYM